MDHRLRETNKRALTGLVAVMAGLCMVATSFAEPLTLAHTEHGVDWTSGGISGVGGAVVGDGSGAITVAGIGAGSVTSARLYWYGVDLELAGGDGDYDNATVQIDGNSVGGVSLGESATNCWGPGASEAYMADVTAYVGGDGNYTITGMAAGLGHDGNGASLVVTFDDGNDLNNRNLFFLEGNDVNWLAGPGGNYPGEDSGWHAVLNSITYSGGDVSIEFHGGDGQDFPDNTVTVSTIYGSVDIIDENFLWDGVSLPTAGNSRAANGELFDIHWFDVTAAFDGELGAAALNIDGQLEFSDCLGLILAVVDQPTDYDQDGVDDDVDACPLTPATDPNVPTVRLGKNRWAWEENDWITNAGGVQKDFTIEETLGCSCEQILDELVEKTELPFDGHYKFGCSQSIVEDWISGWYPLEIVEVPSDAIAGADSVSTLFSGEDYKFIASGVWYNFLDNSRAVDAEYISDDSWLNYADGPQGGDQLDLQVNGLFQNWGAYSASHEYSLDYAGGESTANFRVFDGDAGTNTPTPAWYADNDGSLFVAILLKLW